jgi:DNA-binding HxlR family transcriptional regulator
MRCRQCQPLPEEVARAADLLGRRWMLAILWVSIEEETVRFNEFRSALDGIPPRTLAARLAELEEAGLLERRVHADTRPPRVEYILTELGRRLEAVVEAMRAYAGASAATSR